MIQQDSIEELQFYDKEQQNYINNRPSGQPIDINQKLKELIKLDHKNNDDDEEDSPEISEGNAFHMAEVGDYQNAQEGDGMMNLKTHWFRITTNRDLRSIKKIQEMPFQYKTLKLNHLQEARLIQFEEYDPINNSNRQDGQLTGERLISINSNSNKMSLSKTFNFQMAFNSYNDKQSISQDSLQESSQHELQDSSIEKDKLHNELTMRVDEKIRMIAEEYNHLAQTQGFNELSNSQSFSQDTHQANQTNSARDSQPIFKQVSKRNQSHESSQKPFQRFTLNNNLVNDQENNDLNATLSFKRSSLLQKPKLQDRMSSTQNRTLSFSNHVKDLTFSKVNNNSFINPQYNNNRARNYQTNNEAASSEQQNSESSSNKNKNSSYPFNGLATQSFNRTMAFGQGGFNLGSKRIEDQVAELKYMLENVQCEAKNLKLLLNLKDDQIQMYDSKNQDLINENEELQYKQEDYKQKMEAFEEDNLYLKAIINSQNIDQVQLQKQSIGLNTDVISQRTQICQATFPSVKLQTSQINTIGLSPIKEESHESKIIKDMQKQIDENEKENRHLKQSLIDYSDKIRRLEKEYENVQNQLQMTIKDNQEIKKSYQSENKSLYWQLENQKQQFNEREQRLMEALKALEESKHNSKKKSSKIKSLKKERDALRIEILKLKQIYSEKCDNYKDNRLKLQKKLKKRDDNIQRLEDQLNQYEKLYRNQYQQSNRLNTHQNKNNEWNQYYGNTGKFGTDADQSIHILKSSISSRSLENTRNLNSTAKNALRGINQLYLKGEASKDQSQNVKDILVNQNSNQPLISLSSSPKMKNLTPGSLPSGMGMNGNKNYGNFPDQHQKDKVMLKLKSHYKKLDIEEEKNQIRMMNQNFKQNYTNQQLIHKQYQQLNNHFTSNDKSKSFYSSDIENNTLFDQNHIVMEDQSNSSNFFSNVNNSNSHLFLDDSALMNKPLDSNIHGNQQRQQLQDARYLMKHESTHQIKGMNEYPHPGSYFYQSSIKNQMQGQSTPQYGKALFNNNLKQSVKQQPQHLQTAGDENVIFTHNLRFNNLNPQIQPRNSNYNPGINTVQSKSPISKNNLDTKRPDSNSNLIIRNRSSQNLSQGDLHNNTQNSIAQNRNDSTTSSNRNLHQIKDVIRPPSTSSTNNTSAVYHNQVAMISYQSSSSGGSKQYQSKLNKLQSLHQQQFQQLQHHQQLQQPTNAPTSNSNNYQPYFQKKNAAAQQTFQLGNIYPQYQPNSLNYANFPSSTQSTQAFKQVNTSFKGSSQYPQSNYNQIGTTNLNTSQNTIDEKQPQLINYATSANSTSHYTQQNMAHHKRQRSRQIDNEIGNIIGVGQYEEKYTQNHSHILQNNRS
ncbi:UNKNOWN [Stylonychia lemnae]|uniref:Uncharacterized protein n=1 Tax=Stylonychia lemnae TaxID=5949 RepID=A0A078AHL0_STYLE|nr:UNKNOWN [Stylonychia lemnae]|eukprot:CDW81765.1 UNKNOWN [Stylonychia lemnae]